MDVEEVRACTIYLQRAGSHIYGTNTPNSDQDYRGVCIPTDHGYYFGFLKKFEQKDSGWPPDEDKVVYDLRKTFRLMADANPNMLDLLFTRPEDHLLVEPAWERVLEHRERFLSQKVRHTYGGYAFSQLKRIRSHYKWLKDPPTAPPTREEFGLPDKKLVGDDEMGAFEWLLAQLIEDSKQSMRLSQETKDELSGVSAIAAIQSGIPDEALGAVQKVTGASDGWMAIVAAEKKFKQAKRRWKSYQDWKKQRNPERAKLEAKSGYDTKHAMHLVRLMRMGLEILTTGKVNVFRPDREELLAIRNGAWAYEEVVEYAEDMEQQLAEAVRTSALPKLPDRNFLDELCCDIIAERLKKDVAVP